MRQRLVVNGHIYVNNYSRKSKSDFHIDFMGSDNVVAVMLNKFVRRDFLQDPDWKLLPVFIQTFSSAEDLVSLNIRGTNYLLMLGVGMGARYDCL